MSEERVWLVQVLCPKRHCVLSAAYLLPADASPKQIEAEQGKALLGVLDTMIENYAVNPWCDICSAKRQTWIAEAGRTKWKTLSEAEPVLRLVEAQQAWTRELLKAESKASKN